MPTNPSIVSVVPGETSVTPVTVHVVQSITAPVINPTAPVSTQLVTEGGRVGPRGPQGEPGVKGDKGDPGGITITRTTSTAISGHRMVLLDGSGLVDYASNTSLSHATRIVGMTTNAAALGDSVNIAMYGEVTEPSWNWDISKPVYLGGDGYLTQVEPSAPTAKFSVVVGFPVTPTTLFINIGIPITLIP